MSDETPNATPDQLPTQFQVELPSEIEVGVHADFASVWHTANTFVLDFLAVKRPQVPTLDEQGEIVGTVLEAKVGARIRISPEQIFPMISALSAQANQWLAETGRSTAPDGWMPPEQ